MGSRLQGKVAWVTGGGSGLGEATCIRFAEEGAHVIVTDINADAAKSVAEHIVQTGHSAEHHYQDVTDETAWEALRVKMLEAHGKLDVLVNNAGIVERGNVEEADLPSWRRTRAVNLDAVFLGTQAAVRSMKSTGGSIINISSIEGIVGEPNIAAYNASKGGVRIFTKSAALHCAREGYNIRVNSVHPGFILTPMLENGLAEVSEEEQLAMAKALDEQVPLGGLGEPVDIATGCLFLASAESKSMPGSELVIDGGFTCH